MNVYLVEQVFCEGDSEVIGLYAQLAVAQAAAIVDNGSTIEFTTSKPGTWEGNAKNRIDYYRIRYLAVR